MDDLDFYCSSDEDDISMISHASDDEHYFSDGDSSFNLNDIIDENNGFNHDGDIFSVHTYPKASFLSSIFANDSVDLHYLTVYDDDFDLSDSVLSGTDPLDGTLDLSTRK